MTHAEALTDALSEPEVYALLQQVGFVPPRHGMLGDPLRFEVNQPIVLKGLAAGLLHKSELGAVRFLPYDPAILAVAAETMRLQIEAAGFEWTGALLCEQIAIARSTGLPTEAFVSLAKRAGGWTLLFGFGGLQAEAVAELAAPLCWPMDFVTPEIALEELRRHLLGRIWLGTLRGTRPVTTEAQLRAMLESWWRVRDVADAEGLELLEVNPMVLDPTGTPRPLDGVGKRGTPTAARRPPPADFLAALLAPQHIALAGVSASEGGVGRTMLENLQRSCEYIETLQLIKPGHDAFLGIRCIPDVAALRANPVDLLLIALPAATAVAMVLQLVEQGGGARVVALVAGGIGDGADHDGLGDGLRAQLQHARALGRWTPAIVGPNFVGHWVPSLKLDSSFIPVEKLAAPSPAGGAIALLSQSGAFLLSRRSRNPYLPVGLALALGNQMDVSLSDVLHALESQPQFQVLGLYVEGFGESELEVTARISARLIAQGRRLWLYRAGRTPEGQAAAASHTGAIAGDQMLEKSLLQRVGVALAPTQQAFDAGLAWLGAFPALQPGPVAVVTNAGFESVAAADLLTSRLRLAVLDFAAVERLRPVLEREGLATLVALRLPLDLTPMANERAFCDAIAEVLAGAAEIVVVGLVPFTRRLGSTAKAAGVFAQALAELARGYQKALGVVVDAGPEYEAYRRGFAATGLPVFTRMEDALDGLGALSASSPFHPRAVASCR